MAESVGLHAPQNGPFGPLLELRATPTVDSGYLTPAASIESELLEAAACCRCRPHESRLGRLRVPDQRGARGATAAVALSRAPPGNDNRKRGRVECRADPGCDSMGTHDRCSASHRDPTPVRDRTGTPRLQTAENELLVTVVDRSRPARETERLAPLRKRRRRKVKQRVASREAERWLPTHDRRNPAPPDDRNQTGTNPKRPPSSALPGCSRRLRPLPLARRASRTEQRFATPSRPTDFVSRDDPTLFELICALPHHPCASQARVAARSARRVRRLTSRRDRRQLPDSNSPTRRHLGLSPALHIVQSNTRTQSAQVVCAQTW